MKHETALRTIVLVTVLSAVTGHSYSAPAGLGRGVNFGNMLEGLNGVPVEQEFFDVVKRIGMSHIRLPVSFDLRANLTAPFTLDPTFMTRLDEIISMAIDTNGIKVILDQHFYPALLADPIGEKDRALTMWEQIASRYADRDDSMLYFEIQNEPSDAFNADPYLWNAYQAEALAVIRNTNPTRPVLIAPTQWNGKGGLNELELPSATDENLILTVHYYSPYDFTHQGAEWSSTAPEANSVKWNKRKKVLWWWDSSWSTAEKKVTGRKGLKVTYTGGWAMLSLHQPGGIEDVTGVVVSTNSTTDIKLKLRLSDGKNPDGSWNYVFQSEDFFTGVGEYTFEFSVPDGTSVFTREIHLQNMSEEAQAKFFLTEYYLVLQDGHRVPTFVTKEEAVHQDLEQFVRWGNRHNVPVHLGEFGAYRGAPLQSRKKWTKAVRKAAEEMNIDWSYWELVAGFGFWNITANDYKDKEILNALIKG